MVGIVSKLEQGLFYYEIILRLMTQKVDKKHEYVFAHNEVPFAYKRKRIQGFNG
jgi:hypothetical protein